MNAAQKIDPDLAALREDLSDLRRDLARLMAHLSKDAAKGALKAATQFEDEAQHMYGEAETIGSQAMKIVGRRIKEQPIASGLLAAGIGCVALLLVFRRGAPRT